MNPRPDPPDHSKPIPIPLWRRWREFRIRYLPVLVFVGIAALVGHLWQGHVAPTQASGLAMGRQFTVRSPQDGYIADLQLEPFSSIQAGLPLLLIQPANMDQLEAQLAVVRAEIAAMQASLDPVTGLQRSRLDYEDLRLEKMKLRVTLAADRIDVNRLAREAERANRLFESGLITDAEQDAAVTQVNVAQTRIRENEAVLETLTERLTELATTWEESDTDTALAAAIRVKEEEIRLLEQQAAPIPLHSPVDGMLATVHLPNGSFARQGDVLVTVHAPEVDYVMAYLRQPVRSIPEVGSEVQVLVPARNEWFSGIVTSMGNQMVPIHEMLSRTGMASEYALPMRVQIAPDSPVLPGERIEIRL